MIPSRKEIGECLGPTLARAFFELSNPDIKKFIGLIPPLNGPDEDLWHSPSDLLADKTTLKVPVPARITRATTHKGILELGNKSLKQYELSLEKKIRQSLCVDMKDTQLLIEAEQRRITRKRIEEMQNVCAQQIKSLAEEYDRKLKEALDDITEKHNKILQKALVQTRMNTTLEMMKKMRKEVEFIVTDMNADYERRCLIQRENLIADFNQIIRQERTRMVEKFEEYKQEENYNSESLRAKLENEHREDTVKIIRREQSLCDNQKSQIHQNFMEIIASLEESLKNANEKINKQGNMSPMVIIPSNDSFWRRKIEQILQEFHKFIKCTMKFTRPEENFVLPRLSLVRFGNEESSGRRAH